MEIEKKYKVKELPKEYELYCCKEIEQGYICENPVVRIRKIEEQHKNEGKNKIEYILTYKSKIGLKENIEVNAQVSHELEVPLTKEGYEHLKKKIDGNLIRKKRYIIPLLEELKAELDIFEGYLEGLVIVEVEFPNEEVVEQFVAPDWFGKEVTLDKRYTNKNLIYRRNLLDLEE